MDGDTNYTFPPQELYKGTMLGQWSHFSEDRAESINVFDSRLGSRRLRLLRLFLLNELMSKAQQENTLQVPVRMTLDLFGPIGASEDQIVSVLRFMQENAVVRNVQAEPIDVDSTVVLTRSGAYYTKYLSRTFVYTEEAMFDTAIEDPHVWKILYDLTLQIEVERFGGARMEARYERVKQFLAYLQGIEDQTLAVLPDRARLASIAEISAGVLKNATEALNRAVRKDMRNSR